MSQASGTPSAPPISRASRSRYRKIVRFAAIFLAQAWWYELFLPRIGLRRFAVRGRAARLQYLARRFRVLAADLGGLMIKVGQFLSARLDILPPEITKELEGLQDEVAAEPFDRIREQTVADLGMTLERAYAFFEPTPIAAASLGQAHRARLSPGLAADLGFEDVIVKVQRPGIDEIVAVDLAALRRIARWLSHVSLVSKRADAPALVEEFATTSLEEINYLHEAGNAERFASDFAADPMVEAPVVVWERSALRVLTLSDVTAIKITDVEGLTRAGIDPAAVAGELARVTFQQIFVSGFFHADPHPGNIFVTRTPGALRTGTSTGTGTGTGTRTSASDATGQGTDTGIGSDADAAPATNWHLTYVDFGMMGDISDSLRAGLRKFILAAVGRDSRALVASLGQLGVLLSSADTDELERAMTALFDRFGGMGIAELQTVDPRELEAFGRQFGETIRDLPFQLPESFLLLIRTISLVSGVTSALDHDFNMWDAVDPFARTILSTNGRAALSDLPQQALAFGTTVAGLPRRMDELATRIERGQLAVRTPEVDRRLRSVERSVNRLGSAIVFAALLVGGVFMRSTDDVVGWILMAASALPLLHLIVTLRRR